MLRLWMACCWVLLACAGMAAELRVSSLPDAAALRMHTEFYAGATSASDLDTVRASDAVFKPLSERKPDFFAPAHWLRLRVHNDTAQSGQWLLDLGLPDIQRLSVYQVGASGVRQTVALVPESNYTDRPVPRRVLAVPVVLAAGERAELYLHYRVHGDTPLQMHWLTPAQFDDKLAAWNGINGVLIGILLALLGFAVLQYLALRRSAYRYYIAMLVFVILFQLQIEGYTFAWLWPEQGRWNLFAPVVMAAMIHLTHALFSISLFRLGRTVPWLYWSYMGFALVTLAGLGVFLATDEVGPLLLLFLLFTPLPVVAGVIAWRRQLPAAGYYLVGASGLAVFMNLLFSLSVAGVGGFADVSLFVYPKLGYLLEAILFALALGKQISLLHARHEANLKHRLAEAEQLAQAEADKSRALEAAQQQSLQLAAAGHDLSQPLSSIRFALAALRAQAGNEAATQHIDKALNYTEGLLQTLIAEAKTGFAEQGHVILLEDLLVELHTRHQPAAAAKGLFLRYYPSALAVKGSALVLTRILDNLIGNAVRYTERGGVLIGVRRRPGALEIQVIDTGPGFDLALQRQLMQPFEQTGQLAAERLGHGLGLHIVQALCAQSGYTLLIRSTKGRGTTFGVLMPIGEAWT
ncbi:sensor histidine kinase [Chitinimonas sp. BJYL2]|uniref:sensor histidine kinase n=1 Tax=Chitinimonas sp. BJYL2 TaxID=2976696 RepID=UPI0022B2F983|nr:sensor histidine kinase [Chitinimonas sp. BJYL2]